MPISDAEYRRGRADSSLQERLKKFLKDHPDEAYQANEIAEALGTQKGERVWDDILALVVVSNVAEWLALRGEIQKKMVSGSWYYKCLD